MVCPGGRKGKDSFSEQQVLHLATVSKSLSVSVKLSLDRSQGPLDIDRIALGQGGLSADTMWEQREAEVRALRPRLIRLFVQEYFALLPASGRYHFDTLDKSVDLILRTGATPLLRMRSTDLSSVSK